MRSPVLPEQCSKNMAEKQIAETVREGIVLTLSTDSCVYHVGDTVVAEARVENTSSRPVDYVLGHIGDPDIRITLREAGTGVEVELREEGLEDWAVLPVVRVYTLAPSQSIRRKVVWDSGHLETIRAAAGMYHIQASFRINELPINDLTANLSIEVTGRP